MELRPEVLAFAKLMEEKLRKNDHKGGWKDDLPIQLFLRAQQELHELNVELREPIGTDEESLQKIAHEAADVANMVMMVADACGALKIGPDPKTVVAAAPLPLTFRAQGTEQKPSVGRVVHYQAYGTPGGEFKSQPRAAVITEVFDDNEVMAFVMSPSGLFFNRVKYSAEPKPGCWSWPPRI